MPTAIAKHEDEVCHELQVPGTLLDPDHPLHRGDDSGEKLGRQVGPGDHVVDDDGHAGPLGQDLVVPQQSIVVGPEDVVRRGHLKRGHPQVLHGPPALDGCTGALGDDPRDEGDAPLDLLGHDLRDAPRLLGGEGVALARAPAHGQAVDLGQVEHVPSVRPEGVLIDRVIRAERGG
jgi:hypothetical protein